MRYRGIPGFPAIFLDFIDGANRVPDLLPPPPSLPALVRRAAARCNGEGALRKEVCARATDLEPGADASRSFEHLSEGTSAAVVVIQRPALFGGLLSDLAKTMTAVKLAAFLTRSGQPAVPVCVLVSGPGGCEPEELGFVDAAGHFRACRVAADLRVRDLPEPEWTVSGAADEWLQRMTASLGRHTSTAPVLDTARRLYRAGTPVKRAWSGFMQALFGHDTIVTLDYDRLSPAEVRTAVGEGFGGKAASALGVWSARMQQAGYSHDSDWRPAGEAGGSAVLPDRLLPTLLVVLALPAVAVVTDPGELTRWSAVTWLCRDVHRPSPQIWPRVSLTVVDSRSRRLLERYDIPCGLVHEGVGPLLRRALPEQEAREMHKGLGRLQDDAELRARTLVSRLGPEAASGAGVEGRLSRVHYQLEKLAERTRTHRERRAVMLEDRFRRLCSRLAPEGCLQESRLAALQVLAEGAAGSVERLSDSMDLTSRQHQFLDLD